MNSANNIMGKASNMDRVEIWTTAIVDKVLKPPRVYHHFHYGIFPLLLSKNGAHLERRESYAISTSLYLARSL